MRDTDATTDVRREALPLDEVDIEICQTYECSVFAFIDGARGDEPIGAAEHFLDMIDSANVGADAILARQVEPQMLRKPPAQPRTDENRLIERLFNERAATVEKISL